MTEQEKSILLSKYEKIKGYSSDLFDNEEWAEFDAFCIGYNLAKSEQYAALRQPLVVGGSEQLRAFSKWYEEGYKFQISEDAIKEFESLSS